MSLTEDVTIACEAEILSWEVMNCEQHQSPNTILFLQY